MAHLANCMTLLCDSWCKMVMIVVVKHCSQNIKHKNSKCWPFGPHVSVLPFNKPNVLPQCYFLALTPYHFIPLIYFDTSRKNIFILSISYSRRIIHVWSWTSLMIPGPLHGKTWHPLGSYGISIIWVLVLPQDYMKISHITRWKILTKYYLQSSLQ